MTCGKNMSNIYRGVHFSLTVTHINYTFCTFDAFQRYFLWNFELFPFWDARESYNESMVIN